LSIYSYYFCTQNSLRIGHWLLLLFIATQKQPREVIGIMLRQ
jgi:hypothetical protein